MEHGMTFEEFKAEAANLGGVLPSTGALQDHIRNFLDGKAYRDGDFWAATVDTDGRENYVQLGNDPWYPGMNHNEQGWGRPW